MLESALLDGDVRDEAIARRLIGVVAQQQGDLPRAREELTKSVALLRTLGPDPELTTSLSDRGFVEVFGGSLEEADRILAEAEEMAAEADDRRRLAWIRQHQAWVAFLSGDTELAEERLSVSSGLFDDLGDRSGAGWAMGLLAYVRFFERRFTDAEELATTVRQDALELGELWAPAMMDSLMASVRLWTGRFSDAEELSRRALSGFRELNDRFGIVQALAPRMRALVALGRNQEAERSLEEVLSLADAFGDLAIPTMAAAGTAAHLGLGARAVALSEVALARMLAMHADGSEARITLALGLCQVGDSDRALATLLDDPRTRAVLPCGDRHRRGDVGDGRRGVGRGRPRDGRRHLDLSRPGARRHRRRSGVDADRSGGGTSPTGAGEAGCDPGGDAAAIALATAASAELGSDVETRAIQHLGEGWKRVVFGLGVANERREETAMRDERRFATGLIVGRFDPPHLGHSHMIDWAAERTDRLVVYVNSSFSRDTVPGELRATWLAEAHPTVEVRVVRHSLATDWDDEDLWARWIALFRDHWPHEVGPHAVFSSDAYVVRHRSTGSRPNR